MHAQNIINIVVFENDYITLEIFEIIMSMQNP